MGMVGVLWGVLLATPGSAAAPKQAPAPVKPTASAERHLTNIRQLTFGRQNAEAYFSFSGDKTDLPVHEQLDEGYVCRSHETGDQPLGCYQMYVMDLGSDTIRMVSTGVGTTTCGYFFPGDRRVMYSSTHLRGPNCPPKPKRDGAYRWALDDYDLFSVRIDGQDPQRLTNTPGYDAEATVSPNGKTIVWTSMRDGDLDIYAMDLDGTHPRRLTRKSATTAGRSFHPTANASCIARSIRLIPEEVEQYKALLSQNLVEPGQLELFIMNADGSNKQQITHNGASNFSPYFHPDGHRLIFSSNVETRNESGRPEFHLYLVNEDGTALERLTFDGQFNSFPMFSPDGKRLVWVSDRGAKERGEFNVFLADWVP